MAAARRRAEFRWKYVALDYSLFEKYGSDVIKMPDVVLRGDKNEGTAFMIKKVAGFQFKFERCPTPCAGNRQWRAEKLCNDFL